ncbi:MAG: hypothetical protein HZA52_18340 [Planctomycetes bacterium]|nr:hypothetical protein [Planctomycetota bacterium]
MDELLQFLASITHWASDDPTVRKRRAWIFLGVFVAAASVIGLAVAFNE